MSGIKLNFPLATYARLKGWGYGSFAMKDGSSVKLTTDAKEGITRLYQMKSGNLIAAEAAKGNNQVAAMLDRYAQSAVNKDEVDYAFMNSFNAII